jgi:hypothetical protein
MEPLDRLGADLASPTFQHGVDQGFWGFLSRDEFIVRVCLFAPDERSFHIELNCTSYGDEPIAGRFVNAAGQSVPEAWPCGNPTFEQWIKFRGTDRFICWDQDRIAVNQHHQDWKGRKAWKKKNNQIVTYLNFLRELLHLPARGYDRQPLETTP